MDNEKRYFEEIELGEEFVTPTRTVTEADVVWFAGISGDFEQLHVSEEYAKGTIFGERVAHGLLGLVIFDGFKTRTALVTGIHTLASLGWTWDFRKPIRLGDTLSGRLVIKEKRRTSKGDRGILYIACELRNQHGEIVHEGENRLMVKCRECVPLSSE
jgi:acyl dehydratase